MGHQVGGGFQAEKVIQFDFSVQSYSVVFQRAPLDPVFGPCCMRGPGRISKCLIPVLRS